MTLNSMHEATRLTRAGKLAEATALIQQMLARGASEPKPEAQASVRPTLIDMEPPAPGRSGWSAPGLDDVATSSTAPEPGSTGTRAARTMGGLFSGLKKALRPEAVRPDAALPDGARFEDRSFTGSTGQRRYRLYVPSTHAGANSPLVVMLHGCTQNPEDFAAGTRMNVLAEELGFVVAYPEQARSANVSRCWNWFNEADQRRDGGEAAIIAGITREVMAELSIDPARVFVAGLSAGGAAAAILGAEYPDLFRAVGVHSGLACGAARDMPTAFRAMKEGAPGTARTDRHRPGIRAIVFHGDRDGTVHPVNAGQVVAQYGGPARASDEETMQGTALGGLAYTRVVRRAGPDRPATEQWTVHGAGHAWSGGSPDGSYTEPRGPDASREMVRFFLTP